MGNAGRYICTCNKMLGSGCLLCSPAPECGEEHPAPDSREGPGLQSRETAWAADLPKKKQLKPHLNHPSASTGQELWLFLSKISVRLNFLFISVLENAKYWAVVRQRVARRISDWKAYTFHLEGKLGFFFSKTTSMEKGCWRNCGWKYVSHLP